MMLYVKQSKIIVSITISIIFLITSTIPVYGKSNEEAISEQEYIILFNTIMQHIKSDYVDEVDPQELWKGAIQGMLKVLNDEQNHIYRSGRMV